MPSINSITLQVADPIATEQFYSTAFALDTQLRLQGSDDPTSGFRGFTMSLLVSQPANADMLLDAALDAGATSLKPATKTFWGYGGVVQAPDGAIWKIASSSKRNAGPGVRQIDAVVLLLGVGDVRASKAFYQRQGLDVAKSFGGNYVQFDTPSSPIGLGLYKRRALAKDAGVPADGSGSHRLLIDSDAGAFTDPDGFAWQSPPA